MSTKSLIKLSKKRLSRNQPNSQTKKVDFLSQTQIPWPRRTRKNNPVPYGCERQLWSSVFRSILKAATISLKKFTKSFIAFGQKSTHCQITPPSTKAKTRGPSPRWKARACSLVRFKCLLKNWRPSFPMTRCWIFSVRWWKMMFISETAQLGFTSLLKKLWNQNMS